MSFPAKPSTLCRSSGLRSDAHLAYTKAIRPGAPGASRPGRSCCRTNCGGPAELSRSPMFDPNTVYFGRQASATGRATKGKAGDSHHGSGASHLDCASNGQAKLIVRLAKVGVSGWVNVPADEAPSLAVLGEVDARLLAAHRRFDELAESRTGDPRLQAQIVDQLRRWFVQGRKPSEPD